MGAWYWIGVSVGLGAAVGVLISALSGMRIPQIVAVVASVGGGAVIASSWLPGDWADRLAGIGGLLLAGAGAAQIVTGALRRGGTRGGVATFVVGAAVVFAGIAFIPAAGYLEAIALPALAARLRRTQPERYAGLRTLARD